LSQLTHVAGPSSSLAPAGSATRRQIAPTAASPTTQPTMNAGPLLLAFADTSISTAATIGMGLMATPTAIGRI
jgi:hypothetical protein